MVNPIFRPCRSGDLEELQRLVWSLYSEVRDTGVVRPDVQLTCNELAARPDKGQVVIFDLDGAVAGYAILIFFWSNEYAGDIIEIDELYVDEKFRGQGASTKFFAWLEETFSAQCAGFSLQVAPDNEGAARLYERLGFKPSCNRHLIKLHESGEKPVALNFDVRSRK